MKKIATLMLICLYTLIAPSQDATIRKMDQTGQAAAAWGRFLKQNVQVGATEEEIQGLMKGKFREHAVVHHGASGAYDVIFKIDDFHEVSFSFDKHSRLELLPLLRATKPWLRFPDGSIIENDL